MTATLADKGYFHISSAMTPIMSDEGLIES